jgi:hypothetical protein
MAIEELVGLFIDRGLLGILVLLLLFGWLAPKWIIDEYREREKHYKETIKDLTTGLNKATDLWEAEQNARPKR